MLATLLKKGKNTTHSPTNPVIVGEHRDSLFDRRGREGDGPGGKGAKPALMHSPGSRDLRPETEGGDEPSPPTKLKGHYDSWTV